VDLAVLRAVQKHPRRVMTTRELAAALGIAEKEAATRVAALVHDGHLAGPLQVRSVGGVWSEIGFKLTETGRHLL